MYKILCDSKPLYIPNSDAYQIISGSLKQEVNTSGTLKFCIPETNPHYGQARLMKSIITLYEDDELLFRGRPYAPSRNLYKDNEIVCEGDLAFLNDTIMPPFNYELGSVEGLFRLFIDNHNSRVPAEKQFIVGTVNVVNDTASGLIVRSSIEYMTTWQALKSKLFDSGLGGYLWVRHEANGNYIDYLSDLPYASRQDVIQTINLTDVTEEVAPDDLATVVIPLGAKLKDAEGNDTEQRLTVASVNGGSIYVEDATGMGLYGRIETVRIHDDITEPLNLLTAGQRDLASALGVNTTYTVTAVDLSKAGENVGAYRLGTYVRVKIPNLELQELMLIKGLQINLLNPAANSITVGSKHRSITAESLKTSETIESLQNDLTGAISSTQTGLSELRRELSSAISQSAEDLTSTIQESYYDKANMDQLISQIYTQIQQTADAITLSFGDYTQELNGKFTNLERYIRFSADGIELGDLNSALKFLIGYTQAEFLESDYASSVWANRSFTTDNLTARSGLYLGSFKLVARDNGNVGLVKVK